VLCCVVLCLVVVFGCCVVGVLCCVVLLVCYCGVLCCDVISSSCFLSVVILYLRFGSKALQDNFVSDLSTHYQNYILS